MPKKEDSALQQVIPGDPNEHKFFPSVWEERFEQEINQLFDDAIDRLPKFVDRNFRSFRKVMGRNLSPKTGLGDLVVGIRNIFSGVSEAFGGPEFETTTYTEDEIAEAFEREVLSPLELEALLSRLFEEFEEDLWQRFEEKTIRDAPEVLEFRDHLRIMMQEEIAHDPKLAQAVRSGIHVGIPATLGYFLFSRSKISPMSAKDVTAIGAQDVSLLQRIFQSVRGKYEPKDDDGIVQDLAGNALGVTGAVLGSLIVGGVFEYAFNSMRDLKGSYIRQINTARYVLLYGSDPSNPSGRGILHIVRAIERKFDELPGFAAKAFNLWLEQGIRPSQQKRDGNELEGVEFFSSDAHGDVSIHDALDVTFDVKTKKIVGSGDDKKDDVVDVEITLDPKKP